MVPRRVTTSEARDIFSDLLASVHYGKPPVVVERRGKPYAVLISPEEYDRYRALAKERFFRTVDAIRERNRDADPEQVEADAARAVEEVRSDHDARRESDTGHSRHEPAR